MKSYHHAASQKGRLRLHRWRRFRRHWLRQLLFKLQSELVRPRHISPIQSFPNPSSRRTSKNVQERQSSYERHADNAMAENIIRYNEKRPRSSAELVAFGVGGISLHSLIVLRGCIFAKEPCVQYHPVISSRTYATSRRKCISFIRGWP